MKINGAIKAGCVMACVTLILVVVATVFETRGMIEYADYAYLAYTLCGLAALVLLGIGIVPQLMGAFSGMSLENILAPTGPEPEAEVLTEESTALEAFEVKVKQAIKDMETDKSAAKRICADLEVYATQLSTLVVGLARKIDGMHLQVTLLTDLAAELNKPIPNPNFIAHLAGRLASTRMNILAAADVQSDGYWDGLRAYTQNYLGSLHAQVGAFESLGRGTLIRLALLERGIMETQRIYEGSRLAVPLLRASDALGSGSVRLQDALGPAAVSITAGGDIEGELHVEPLTMITERAGGYADADTGV
jgi:hypothetical protein